MPETICMICRECGALTTMQQFEDANGLCGRCAAGRQLTGHAATVRRMYVNGVEVVGDEAIYAALKAQSESHAYPYSLPGRLNWRGDVELPNGFVVGESPIQTAREALSLRDAIDITALTDQRRRTLMPDGRVVEGEPIIPERERDPFRDAIDRAAADWADDNPEDPEP